MNLTKNARRCAAALAVPALLLTAASCGSDDDKGSVADVSGKFGKAPVVKADAKKKPEQSHTVKTLLEGKGAEVKKGDFVRLDGMMRPYDKSQALVNTYGKAQNGKVQQDVEQVGGAQASKMGSQIAVDDLKGKKVGSRVLVQGNAKEMFPQTYQQMQVKADQVFDWVLDIRAAQHVSPTAEVKGKQADPESGMPKAEVPAQKPNLKKDPQTGAPADPKKVAKITVPKGAKAPKKVEDQTLIKGDGPVVKKGEGLIAQYTGVTWDGGKVFDSSWKHGGALGFQIGTGSVIDGWDQALEGKKVGDRVLLVAPKKYAYGEQKNPQNAAAGHDLVFVVDIVGKV